MKLLSCKTAVLYLAKNSYCYKNASHSGGFETICEYITRNDISYYSALF